MTYFKLVRLFLTIVMFGLAEVGYTSQLFLLTAALPCVQAV